MSLLGTTLGDAALQLFISSLPSIPLANDCGRVMLIYSSWLEVSEALDSSNLSYYAPASAVWTMLFVGSPKGPNIY